MPGTACGTFVAGNGNEHRADEFAGRGDVVLVEGREGQDDAP